MISDEFIQHLKLITKKLINRFVQFIQYVQTGKPLTRISKYTYLNDKRIMTHTTLHKSEKNFYF